MARPAPVRLDALLVKRGLAQSRQRARELIEAGHVLIDGLPATKSSTRVRPDRPITLAQEDSPWVGRGALKLLSVIDRFGVQAEGLRCADLGASTGGFTQVLLERGAVRVYAIDVGRGQLARPLVTDPRVVVMDGVNARTLESLPEPIDLVVGDLSFISLALILPTVARLLRPGGEAVLLVKPQFEAGPGKVSKGGRVRDPQARAAAIDQVRDQAVLQGFHVLDGADCGLPGARAKNVEHFLHLRLPRTT
ncbi:MAG: TlyA family RNA methyltransferase [Deltaproteobacteria bacterium]|nr:MAG: TlyA family RNA methyltransferase [Deltaproteobacteria bacterium]